MAEHKQVLVAARNVQLRSRLIQMLERGGYEVRCVTVDTVVQTPLTGEVLLIDTDDDVDTLVRFVQHLYRVTSAETTLPLIAFLSEQAIAEHPTVGVWTVSGHAALVALIPSRDDQFELSVRELLQRIMSDDR